MKLSIALLLFISASLYADERSDYIRALPKEQIIATIEHMQQLTRDAETERAAAVEQNEFITGKLAEMQRDNEAARVLAAQAEQEMQTLREWGNEQATIATKAQEERDKAKAMAAHRGRIIGMALAGFGMFFVLYLLPSIVPLQYRLAAGAAGGIAGFAVGRWLL